MSMRFPHGDTLIEVMFSVTVFALVIVVSINLMNGGINTAQKTLEVTMTRNEIDAQAEAIRFIHNSYLAERELASSNHQFYELWRTIVDTNAITPSSFSADYLGEYRTVNSCSDLYGEGGAFNPTRYVGRTNSFILNTRLIQPRIGNSTQYQYGDSVAGAINYEDLLNSIIVSGTTGAGGKLQPANLYPRIIYSRLGTGDIDDSHSSAAGYSSLKESEQYLEVSRAEGIWLTAVRGGDNAEDVDREPEYYDFYIQSCWHSIGKNTPTSIVTIVRLYNPEVID